MTVNPKFFPKTKPLEAWRQALMDAAQRIRERGWTKGVLCDEAGRVCLLGAIHDVREPMKLFVGGFLYRPERTLAHIKMAAAGRLANWNDAPERTADEVIAMLEAAALQP